MKYAKGDLIEMARKGQFDVVVHGCNCFCTMGAGIAKSIAAAFPEALSVDRQTTKGDRSKLGTCSVAQVERSGVKLSVVNAYTQYDYRGSGPKVEYDAVRLCMRWIRDRFESARIGIPKIGAGLAGGDWVTIEKIVREELGDREVTVVEFSASK
jgi:O-acetyl-ADP-ribose deacetylase (regulator of RNase III)